MQVVQAELSEAEEIVKELWLPLAREMEKISDYNELRDDLDITKVVEHKKEKIEDEEGYIFLAKEDDEFVAYISIRIKESVPVFSRGKKLKISELFVKKEYRRKGYASKLLDRAEELFQDTDCSTMELDVNIKNKSAKELYEKKRFDIERYRMVKRKD